MQTLTDLQQGSQEWLDERRKRFTASDAPALMGASKYKTRKQLLDEKSGGPSEVITPAKQKIFDKGHKAEDDARDVLSVEEMDDYAPCVGLCSTPGLEYLMASFDGRSDDGDHLYEHKLWNEALAENVRNNTLAPSHYWQLEHQLLVDEQAEYVLFVVSDGTADKRVMMKYYAVEGRAEELISAWAMFKDDLEGHKIEAKEELVIAQASSLPAIQCTVKGSQITTNMGVCLMEIKELAKSEMSRSFETDQDFADKEQLNKDVKKARAELKARIASVKSEFVSYSEFESIADEMDSVLQKMQSHGEKQVKQAKEAKKEALKQSAISSLGEHVRVCNTNTGATFGIDQVITITPDWQAAMKNKRTIKSIEDALDTELNKWKITISSVADLIKPNFEFLSANANDCKFLFQDVFSLINQPVESFQAIVTTRIDNHKKEEAEKLAIETARIEKEAKIKAEAAAAEKLKAEAEAIRQQERDKIKAEQLDRSQEKAKADKLAQDVVANFCKEEAKKKAANPGVITNIEQPKQSSPMFGSLEPPVESQLQKSSNAVSAQSSHKNLHSDFMQWAAKNKIGSNSFLELEKLINQHYA